MSLSKKQQVRFGVVGTNFISDWIIAASRQEKRFELVAVCSRTQEKADAFAAKHNIPHTFTSLEEMAQSPLIDAVYIASPNSLHAEQSILCMREGKHLLCEKPLASNAAEARRMIETARKHGVTLMEAMKPTLTPNFAAVMANLGRVGKLRHYFSSYCQYSSRYDKFKTGIPVNAFDLSLSNGAVMDIGVYTIYPMVVLFGKPQQIKAQGILMDSGADGFGTVNFEYKGGFNATVIYSKISDSELATEIQGEAGNITMDRINIIKQVYFSPSKQTSSGRGIRTDPEDISARTDQDEYFYEIKEFIDLISEGKLESNINSLQHSLITLEIIDEIRRQLGVIFPADKLC